MSISFLNQDQGDGVEQLLNTDHVVFPNLLDMDMGMSENGVYPQL